jgi:hypothetical protein
MSPIQVLRDSHGREIKVERFERGTGDIVLFNDRSYIRQGVF